MTMVIGNRPEIAKSLFAPGYTMASVFANEFSEATGDVYLLRTDRDRSGAVSCDHHRQCLGATAGLDASPVASLRGDNVHELTAVHNFRCRGSACAAASTDH